MSAETHRAAVALIDKGRDMNVRGIWCFVVSDDLWARAFAKLSVEDRFVRQELVGIEHFCSRMGVPIVPEVALTDVR